MKKETQYSEGQNLWNTMKNDSQKLSHEITKLKAKAATINSRNLHMWSSFLKPSSAASKRVREENASQVEEQPDEAISVVGKSIQIIVQLFSMLEL